MSTPLLILQISKTVSSSPSFRTFTSRIKTSIHLTFSHQRPWPELVQPAAFSRPKSLPDSVTRIRNNVTYFRTNYLTLICGILAFSLISHPVSLVSLLLLASGWIFLYVFKPSDQPLVLFGRSLSSNETLAVLVGATIVVLFFTNVASIIVSGTLVGVAVVCVHGAFRDPVELFLDEQAQDCSSSAGFFSVGKGGSIATSPAASLRDVVSIV